MEKEDCNMFFEGDDCKKGELLLVRFAKDSRVNFIPFPSFHIDLTPTVQKVDSAIHRMDICAVDIAVGFS